MGRTTGTSGVGGRHRHDHQRGPDDLPAGRRAGAGRQRRLGPHRHRPDAAAGPAARPVPGPVVGPADRGHGHVLRPGDSGAVPGPSPARPGGRGDQRVGRPHRPVRTDLRPHLTRGAVPVQDDGVRRRHGRCADDHAGGPPHPRRGGGGSPRARRGDRGRPRSTAGRRPPAGGDGVGRDRGPDRRRPGAGRAAGSRCGGVRRRMGCHWPAVRGSRRDHRPAQCGRALGHRAGADRPGRGLRRPCGRGPRRGRTGMAVVAVADRVEPAGPGVLRNPLGDPRPARGRHRGPGRRRLPAAAPSGPRRRTPGRPSRSCRGPDRLHLGPVVAAAAAGPSWRGRWPRS